MSSHYHQTYDKIGSKSTAGAITRATLTALFTDNLSTGVFKKNMQNVHIEGSYLPQTNNAYVLMRIEFSNEEYNGGPVNWFPLDTQVPATTEIDLYADSGTQMGTNAGIPVILPGDKTSTAGTAIPISYDFQTEAVWVRISFIEQVAAGNPATFGSIYASVTVGD